MQTKKDGIDNMGYQGDVNPAFELESKTDLSKRSGDEAEEPEKRQAWGGQLEFILTCVGYAVGLGNVWRFPYLCYKNGGGAFLIPYVIMLAFVGLPLFFLELSFGQFTSQGPLSVWAVNPLFKGLGYSMVMVSLLIGLYYNVIIAWCIYFFFASMRYPLPWTSCDRANWATERCLDSSEPTGNVSNITTTMSTLTTAAPIDPTFNRTTPTEEYFYINVLGLTSGLDNMGGVRWQLALCLLAAWLIVFLVLIKGISSLGKVVYFTSIFPYVLLTALLIRGCLLPGAGEGIRFYLQPNITRLADAEVWSDAAVQIFYSLSACSGGLIAMASYNKFSNNCLRDSLIVPLINCGTSIYSGFVIFSVLGFMAERRGVSVDRVATSGPGLVFVVYPEGLAQMPGTTVWAILFFFMMMCLGFSSEFSIIECVFSAFSDEFPQLLRRNKWAPIIFRGICCACFFLIGLPMVTGGGFYLFNIVDSYTGGFPLLFVGLFELIALVWIYGYHKFKDDIEIMLGKRQLIYFHITWRYIAPLLLLAVIVFRSIQYKTQTLDTIYGLYRYPPGGTALGWLIVTFAIIWIPLFFIGTFCVKGGGMFCWKSMQATKNWRPRDRSDREGTKYDDSLHQDVSTISSGHINSNGTVPPTYEEVESATDYYSEKPNTYATLQQE
ncbi:unnamed protein product [Owenia fusiformis]|uniref:Transporter n=1 Tax=Owenia fusiformis TaxID=6347 RepID=A0A8S4P5W0_OWEFU|nr:unnamed protein product [Owenia fusiformis]